jgi:hypothetical protein
MIASIASRAQRFVTIAKRPSRGRGTELDLPSITIFRNIARLRQIGTTGNLRMPCMTSFRLACRANQ